MRGRTSGGLGILAVLVAIAGACGPPPPPPAGEDPELALPSADEVAVEARAQAREAWSRGVYLRERGDIAGALREFGEAVRRAPRAAEFRVAYAHALLEAGRFREADAFLQEAERRFGGTAREEVLLARLALASGDGDAALAWADSACRSDPLSAEAYGLRGRVLLDVGRVEDAQRDLARADSLAPNDPGTLEGLAEAARRSGHLEEAQAALERVLRLDPTLAAPRRSLAGLYAREGRAAAAKELVLEGLEVDPQDPERLESAVETFVQSGDLEGAARILQPYAARRELAPPVELVYARILLQLDHLARADSVLASLTDVAGIEGVETLRGDVAARDGRVEDATRHYRAAAAREPDDCVPRASLALLEAQHLRATNASAAQLAASDSALAATRASTSPESFRCNVLLGHAYLARRRHADAARHLAAAAALDPENPEILFNLAMACAENGDSDQALVHGRALLGLEPDNPAALNLVGYILAERGEHLDEGEQLVRRALAREPENGYFVDSLGWVLYQKGDYAAAAVELERAVRLTSERDALILEHLGDAYVRQRRWSEARGAYARALAIDAHRAAVSSKLAEVETQLGGP